MTSSEVKNDEKLCGIKFEVCYMSKLYITSLEVGDFTWSQ